MADINLSMPGMLLREGGYQNDPDDFGNYNSKGELVGTNHGISAKAFESYYGFPPSQEDMESLSQAEATPIYAQDFWNPIKGDEIRSQEVADIVFDAKVNQTYAAVKLLQTVLNNAGRTLLVDGWFGNKTLKATNTVDPAIVHNGMLEARELYYRYRAGDLNPSDPWYQLFSGPKPNGWRIGIRRDETGHPIDSKFLTGWLNRLNHFPEMEEPVEVAWEVPCLCDINPVELNKKKETPYCLDTVWLRQVY